MSRSNCTQNWMDRVEIKSCGHPNARQIERDEPYYLEEAICLDCLCHKLSFLGKNSSILGNGPSEKIQKLAYNAKVDTGTIDCLAGFALSMTDSSDEHFVLIDAMETILRVVDGISRKYLVFKFAQAVKNGMTFGSILCQEIILNDKKCLDLFLGDHGDVLEHVVFRTQSVTLESLPYVYRILKTTCAAAQVAPCKMRKQNSGPSKRKSIGVNSFVPHTLKITSDILNCLKENENEDLIFACLDFLVTFFENHDAVYVTFHCDNTVPLCGLLRKILISNRRTLQKVVIEVLTMILVASNSTVNKYKRSQQQQSWESIPSMIVTADLDNSAYSCFGSNDIDLINSTIQFFHLLSTKGDFQYEKVVPTLEVCLRTICAKLKCDGLNLFQIYNFFSSCLSKLNHVDYILQQLILSLCKSIQLATNWTVAEKLNYFKLLFYCKDSRIRKQFYDICKSTKKSKTTSSHLGSLRKFLIVCKDILICDTDSLNSQFKDDLEFPLLQYFKDDMYLPSIFDVDIGSEVSFDLARNLLRVIRMYSSVEEIGRLGLELLLSLLKNGDGKNTMGLIGYFSISSKALVIMCDTLFLKFIESALNLSESPPEHCFVTYEIMTYLQEATVQKQFLCPNIKKVEWSMTCFISYMKFAVTDLDYLKFLISMLECDFKSDLVEISEVVHGECISPALAQHLLNVVFNLENLLYQIIDDSKANYIWITLTEILKYLERRIILEPIPLENSNCLKNLIFSAHLLFMIESYLFIENEPTPLINSILDFFCIWTKLLLIVARSTTSPLCTTMNNLPNLMKPMRLEIILLRLQDWTNSLIENGSQWRNGSRESHTESQVKQIDWQIDEFLNVIKPQYFGDEEDETESPENEELEESRVPIFSLFNKYGWDQANSWE